MYLWVNIAQDREAKHGRANPRNPRSKIEISTLQEFTKDLEDKLQAHVVLAFLHQSLPL